MCVLLLAPRINVVMLMLIFQMLCFVIRVLLGGGYLLPMHVQMHVEASILSKEPSV